MSTLPLISHHLFVSAIGNEEAASGQAADQVNAAEPASTIPLEVLDATKPLPPNATRPLRASVARPQVS
jgi:hypothetical protein